VSIYEAAAAIWPNPDALTEQELLSAENQLRTLADGFAVLVRQRKYPAPLSEYLPSGAVCGRRV